MPRKCTVCTHTDREAIDTAIVSGEPLRSISLRCEVSQYALSRHKPHVSTTVAKAAEAGEVAEADQLLEVVRGLLQAALTTIDQAEKGGDLRVKLLAIGKASEQAKLLLEVMGKLQTAPTFNIIMSAEWISIRTTILQALEPFPAARLAVADALVKVE